MTKDRFAQIEEAIEIRRRLRIPQGDTGYGGTAREVEELAARVRELEAQREQDIDAAVRFGFNCEYEMGLTLDEIVAHFKAIRKGGSE